MAFSTHDQVPDSPTNVFATLNPLVVSNSALSDGNLRIVTPAALTNNVLSTIQFPNEGKWFFEILYISYEHHNSGIINKSTNTTYTVYQNGFYTNSANPSTLSANSYSTSSNSVIGLLINFENVQATVTIYINGTSVGGPFNIDAGEYFSVFNDGASATGGTQIVNFGQDHLFGGATLPTGAGSNTPDNGIGTFAFSVPTGATALCTANLPDPDIDPAVDDLPEDYMRPVVISGTNADNNNVFVGFPPDLCWLKNRNGASGHMIVDSVRGAGYALQSDNPGQEGTYNIANDFKEFTSTGFNLGAVSAYGSSNPSGTNNIISWCFRAGGAPDLTSSPTKPFAKDNVQYETLSAANITAGTITPTAMSVNTKAGFSIVKYVGAGTSNARTIPHGLSDTPDLIIIKDLDGSNDWIIWFQGFGADSYLRLNTSAAKSTVSNAWGGSPNSNTFSVYQSGAHNTSGRDYIAYCWHSVAGYSKFGSYIGNGSTDGPFVYCGFRPAFVICKVYDYSSSYASWAMFDNARDSSNVMNKVLYANKSKNEGYRGDASTAATNIHIDFLSNGFKPRSSQLEHNANGDGIIYMAFAEQPFKFSNAR